MCTLQYVHVMLNAWLDLSCQAVSSMLLHLFGQLVTQVSLSIIESAGSTGSLPLFQDCWQQGLNLLRCQVHCVVYTSRVHSGVVMLSCYVLHERKCTSMLLS